MPLPAADPCPRPPSSAGQARARWYPALLAQLEARRVAGAARAGVAHGLPRGAEAFDARNETLRPIFEFKEKLFGSAKVAPTISTFPIAEVSNGHTFFVQKMHDIVGVPPVAVHCTYQYGDDTGYAYGKRQRLRDAGLWLVDPPSYYAEGKYLQLVSGLARQHGPQQAPPPRRNPSHTKGAPLSLRQRRHHRLGLRGAPRRRRCSSPRCRTRRTACDRTSS